MCIRDRLHREHIPYRRIGEISVDTTLDRAGIPHTDAEVSWLVAQIEKLRPFPDVPAAMALLHKRYQLAVLSNGDPDMLEAARPYHGIAFDHIISCLLYTSDAADERSSVDLGGRR